MLHARLVLIARLFSRWIPLYRSPARPLRHHGSLAAHLEALAAVRVDVDSALVVLDLVFDRPRQHPDGVQGLGDRCRHHPPPPRKAPLGEDQALEAQGEKSVVLVFGRLLRGRCLRQWLRYAMQEGGDLSCPEGHQLWPGHHHQDD